MNNPSIKFAHVNIVSKDWKSLSKFYIKVFGCVPVPPERDLSGDWLAKGTALKNPHLRGQHLRLPGHGENDPTLEIFQYDEMLEGAKPATANRKGLGHLAFKVADVTETLQVLLENGGSELGEVVVRQIPDVGEITFTYALDPEGNILELQSWKAIT